MGIGIDDFFILFTPRGDSLGFLFVCLEEKRAKELGGGSTDAEAA